MLWTTRSLAIQKSRLLGLDISSAAVKILELKNVQGNYVVQQFGQYPLVPAVMDGTVVQSIDGLADAVRQLLVALNYPPKTYARLQVVIALPDACTIRKTITVSDRLDDVDLEILVRMELEKLMPKMPEDLCFDFKRMPSLTKRNGLNELLIIATRLHYVQHRVAALHQIGLQTHIVDVESLAIARTLPLIVDKEDVSTIIALLDIGAGALQVLFFKKGAFLFKHQEAYSQDRIDDLSYDDGDLLLASLKRACQFFYAAQSDEVSIAKLFLAGEGSKAALCSCLGSRLAIPVHMANPFLSMQYADGLNVNALMKDAPLYITACGLAQRVH